MQAGICAAQGPRHGAFTNRVENFLTDMAHRQDIEDAVLHRLRNGDPVPGFGHPLYPEGDPRVAPLLTAEGVELARVVEELTGAKPTLDFALVAAQRALGLPPGAAFLIFAMGRTAGWIAHALEQRKSAQLIRPRANYVGPEP